MRDSLDEGEGFLATLPDLDMNVDDFECFMLALSNPDSKLVLEELDFLKKVFVDSPLAEADRSSSLDLSLEVNEENIRRLEIFRVISPTLILDPGKEGNLVTGEDLPVLETVGDGPLSE